MKNKFRQSTDLTAVFIEQQGKCHRLGIVAADGRTPKSENKTLRVFESLARYFGNLSLNRGTARIPLGVVSARPFIAVNPAHIKDVSSAGEKMIFTVHGLKRSFSVTHAEGRQADTNSFLIYNSIVFANNEIQPLPAMSPLTADDRAIVALHLKNLQFF